MKRPEGFDRTKPGQPVRVVRRGAAPSAAIRPVDAAGTARSGKTDKHPLPGRLVGRWRGTGPASRKVDSPAPVSAKKQLRLAVRQRRQFERSEVKRFTRHARRRRLGWLVTAGIVFLVAGIVTVAVYSPLFALRTITIEGASRVDAQKVHQALEGQIGTPLALVDLGRITRELAAFPAIRSYVTQTVPPNTLVIHIVERQPIGVIAAGSGFELVDPAGVVLGGSSTQPAGMPVIDLAGASKDSAAFQAAASVIQALPASLRSQVASVTATTKDDVTLLLTGGERVLWGSAERSDYKARVLKALIAQRVPHVVQYDVSAPDSAVITRG